MVSYYDSHKNLKDSQDYIYRFIETDKFTQK
jgi:hypothetical protein